MRKYLIMVLTMLVLAFSVFCVIKGMQIGPLKIASYEYIEKQDKELDDKINQFNDVRVRQLEQAKKDLEKQIKELETQKKDYQAKIDAAREAGADKEVEIENYDMEFLWATIGNYATRQNVNITLQVKDGARVSEDFKGYKDFRLLNLQFTCIGTYADITEFLYKIESDEKFGARLSNFSLTSSDQLNSSTSKEEKGKQNEKTVNTNNLVAKFEVKNVPINVTSFKIDSIGGSERPMDERDPRFTRPGSEESDRDKYDRGYESEKSVSETGDRPTEANPLDDGGFEPPMQRSPFKEGRKKGN